MNRTFGPGRILAFLLLLTAAAGTAAAADNEPFTTRIEAAGGAGAGTITGGTFNIYNHDPEELKRLAERLDRSEHDYRAAEAEATELARQLNLQNVTTQTVLEFLRLMASQQDLTVEQVPAKMAEITANYLRMQERIASQTTEDPIAAGLLQRAAAAGKAGHFEDADRLLARAEARETKAIDENRLKVAQLRAARGDNAATQLHHVEAARHYEAAAEILPQAKSSVKGLFLIRAGDLWMIPRNLSEAGEDFEKAQQILNDLVKDKPDNRQVERDLSVSYERLGDVFMLKGHYDGALAAYRDAIVIVMLLSHLDASNSALMDDLSVCHRKIGDALMAKNDHDGALVAYRNAFAIAETLARLDPGHAQWQRNLGVSYDRMGAVLLAKGDYEGALAPHRAALAVAETFVQHNPNNTLWRRDRSVSYQRIGDVLLVKGDCDGALKSYRAGLEIIDALVRHDPDNVLWQRDRIILSVKVTATDPKATETLLADARDVLKQLQASGRLAPVDTWMPEALARLLAKYPAKNPASCREAREPLKKH